MKEGGVTMNTKLKKQTNVRSNGSPSQKQHEVRGAPEEPLSGKKELQSKGGG